MRVARVATGFHLPISVANLDENLVMVIIANSTTIKEIGMRTAATLLSMCPVLCRNMYLFPTPS